MQLAYERPQLYKNLVDKYGLTNSGHVLLAFIKAVSRC